MTNREKFDVIGKVFEGYEDAEIREEILEFVEKQIAALDAKNAKAKARAAEKRAEGDELRGILAGMLTEEPKTVNDILAEVGDENLTPAKIVSRMTQLVKTGQAVKETVKVEGRKLVGYIKA